MGLSVTVLGCSGTYAAPGGACSGYLVASDTTKLWVDAGPGTLGNLQLHASLDELTGMVVSHVHPDHWLELLVLYNALKWYRPRPQLPVYTTQAVAAALRGFHPEDLDVVFDLNVIDRTSRITIGDIDVRFSQTDHPVETLAMRFDHDGSSIVYSSDTGPGWSLAELGPHIDLALCEATMLDADRPDDLPHLSACQAGRDARESGVGRLVVTHYSPEGDPADYEAEAQAAFGRSVHIAAPHERYDV